MAGALKITFIVFNSLQVLLSIICTGVTGGFVSQLHKDGLGVGSLSNYYLAVSVISILVALALLICRCAASSDSRAVAGSALGISLFLTLLWVAAVARFVTAGGLDNSTFETSTYTVNNRGYYIYDSSVDTKAAGLAKGAFGAGVILFILYLITSILGCVDVSRTRRGPTNFVPQVAMQPQGYANKPSAYPQQAYPQQAYPQQAYPQQAYPQQAYPPQGYPQQGVREIPQGADRV